MFMARSEYGKNPDRSPTEEAARGRTRALIADHYLQIGASSVFIFI
jgi:hypothetical protein